MNYRVIIADDEPLICEGLAKIIPWGELGLELVATFNDGQALAEALLCLKPDIVILDIEMPGKNGIEIVREFANMDIQYIIASAYNEFEYAQAVMVRGVREYLIKPISKSELVRALSESVKQLREKRSRQQLFDIIAGSEQAVIATLRKDMLRDLLQGLRHDDELMYEYCEMQQMENQLCRLVVLLDEQDDSELYSPFVFKELSELFLAGAGVECSTTVDDLNVVIVRELSLEKVQKLVDDFRKRYKQLYNGSATAVISDICLLKDIRDEFLRMKEKEIEIPGSKDVTESSASIVEKIKEIVASEYMNEELNVKNIAVNRLFITPDYAGRVFKKHMKISITRYITQVRIEKAEELLMQKKHKIYEVAYMCGFGENPQYFSQIFKKITGVLPKEYNEYSME